MTKENEKLRDCLRDAESIITNALRSQPEGDNECKIHLTKAVKDVWNLVYDAKSQMPDGSKYAMEGMGHPSAYDRLFNAAALREALVKIEKMAHCDLGNVYPRYRDEFNDKIGGIEREARAALAAPPRNCDRFGGDNALLQKAYLSECGGNYNPLDANSRQAYLVGYGNWLLAPAKKGTAK